MIQTTSFFQNLETAYDSCSTAKKAIFVSTEEGLSFIEEPDILSRDYLRMTWDSFFTKKINLNLPEVAQQLVQKATEIFKNFPPPPEETVHNPLELSETKELFASMKILRIALDLLKKSKDSPEEEHRALYHQCIPSAVHLLSQYGGISSTKTYIIQGFLDLAYEEILNQEIPEDLSIEELQQLLPIALDKNDLDFALKLIEKKICLKELSTEKKTLLAWQALEQNNDHVLSLLITAGCKIKGGREEQILLEAISKKMVASVQALLERDVNLTATREDGNTALHIAYLSGNVTIIRLISKHISPLAKNDSHNTPLMAVLQNSISSENFRQIIGELSPSTTPPPNQRDLNALKNLLPNSLVLPTNLNWVELSFLLDDERLQQKVFSLFFREDIEASCKTMREKYSEEEVNAFFLKSFKICQLHLQTGCTQFAPSAVPQNNPEILELLDIFDSVESYASKESQKREEAARERGDVNEAEQEKEKRERVEPTRPDRKKALETFLKHVKEKTPRTGTPKSTDKKQLDIFYNTIELEIKHIISTILSGNCTPDITEGVLKEFIETSGLCGPRYFAIALEQYLRVCKGCELTPLSRFQTTIAEYRKELLWAVICEKYPDEQHSVHLFNKALFELGKGLGIPGYQQMQKFNDNLGPNLSLEISNRFWKLYTPENIILGRYLPEIKDAATTRNTYLDLHKEFTPWKEEHYSKLQDGLKKTSNADDFLQKSGISQANGQTPEEAVKAHQTIERLESFVYDDENVTFRFEALVFLFERLGVITSKTRWKDKDNEIKHILEAPGLIRQFLGLVGVH